MRNKKVLITGVTGMVGSHLTDLLLKKTNWKIYGMCRWRSPLNNLHHLLDLANKKKRLEFIYGDLCDVGSINKVINFKKKEYKFVVKKIEQDFAKNNIKISFKEIELKVRDFQIKANIVVENKFKLNNWK